MMTRAWTWPVLGITLLVAVMIGINLGNATVAGINPTHFESRRVTARPFVLDAVPAANLTRRMPNYSQLYGWRRGRAALADACGPNCGRTDTYTASVPYFGSREELAAREMRQRREIDSVYAEEVLVSTHRAAPDKAEIERPVDAEPVVTEPVGDEVEDETVANIVQE